MTGDYRTVFMHNRAMLLGCVVLLTCMAARADIPLPANVDFELVSPTEDYHFFIELDVASSDYYSPIKALADVLAIDRTGSFSVGNPKGYHHGYQLLGFLEPNFNGNIRNINYWDCDAAGCDNGFATAGQIILPAPDYLYRSNACTRAVLGHELFHKVQRTYRISTAPDNPGKWVSEGHARAMQDKIYTDLDTDPAASCTAGYNDAVRFYLAGNNSNPPQQQLSIWNNSYRAALWWTYLMEQFGNNNEEPAFGADFITEWYEQAVLAGESANSFDITNQTIQVFDPANDILTTFRRFALANVIKDMDLTDVSDEFRDTYSYVDEQANGPIDQNLYAQVRFADTLTVSNAQSSDLATYLAAAYGSQYFDVDISQCLSNRAVRVSFAPSILGPPDQGALPINQLGAWGVVVGQSSDGSGDIGTLRPAKYFKKLDQDWAVEFIQPANPYDRVFVSTTGVVTPIFGHLTAECEQLDTLGPDLPLVNPLNPQTPGPPDTLTYTEVCASPGIALPNLDPFDYTVAIDGEPVFVLAASPRDDGHCLQVEIPPTTSTEPQKLTVTLAGQSTTVANAFVRNTPVPEVLVLLDTSSTTLLPADNPKLEDFKQLTAAFIVQLLSVKPAATPPKIGLIEFFGNNVEPDVDAQVIAQLQTASTAHLTTLDSALAALRSGPNRFTSIGDAIQVALNEFGTRGDPKQAKHAVLITDGSENEGAFWADLKSTVKASGIIFHVLAVGPAADQPLAYEIARSTGGHYGYVAVGATETDHVALSAELAAIAASINGGVQIASLVAEFDETGLSFNTTFAVPPQTTSMLIPAVQAARATVNDSDTVIGELVITAPDNTAYRYELKKVLVVSYNVNGNGGSSAPLPPGNWQASITIDPGYSGELKIDVFADRSVPLLFKPTFSRSGSVGYRVGAAHSISIGAAQSVGLLWHDACGSRSDCVAGDPDQPVIIGSLPNGLVSRIEPETFDATGLPLIPPVGQEAGEAHLDYLQITMQNVNNPLGSPTGFADNGSATVPGSYLYQVEMPVHYDGYTVKLLARDSYAVNSSIPVDDVDGDGLPSIYEDRHGCLDFTLSDATFDQDGDGLYSIEEFYLNTNPCDADSDRGGELDGSEVAGGRDPLLITDDALPGATYLVVANELTDVDEETVLASNAITLQFANSPTFNKVTLKRGVFGEPGLPGVIIYSGSSPVDGRLIDTTVVPGTKYCYQLEPNDKNGNAGRPSEVVCALAAVDPAMPWGDLEINAGAPRTDNPELRLNIGLYNKGKSGSEMLVEVDNISSGWIPYASDYIARVALSEKRRTIFASVRLRDAVGIESLPYADSIELWPAESLGGISGRILLEGLSGGSPGALTNVIVWLEGAENQPPAFTDAAGYFEFLDLIPGSYVASSGHRGWLSVIGFCCADVPSGRATEAGQVILPLPGNIIFNNSFED